MPYCVAGMPGKFRKIIGTHHLNNHTVFTPDLSLVTAFILAWQNCKLKPLPGAPTTKVPRRRLNSCLKLVANANPTWVAQIYTCQVSPVILQSCVTDLPVAASKSKGEMYPNENVLKSKGVQMYPWGMLF